MFCHYCNVYHITHFMDNPEKHIDFYRILEFMPPPLIFLRDLVPFKDSPDVIKKEIFESNLRILKNYTPHTAKKNNN